MENINKILSIPVKLAGGEEKYYLKAASSKDLSGKDRIIYRLLEIIPGVLCWSTILGVVILSWLAPIFTAVFIISFDIYWLIKTFFLSLHLNANWKKLRKNLKIDWEKELNNLYKQKNTASEKVDGKLTEEPLYKKFKWEELWQMVIMPFYKESEEVISESMESLLKARWPNHKMIVVLSSEERAGEEADRTAKIIEEKYKNKFGYFMRTSHPKDIEGEIPGKGSNIHFAGEKAKEEIVEKYGLEPEKILVSSFDVDTVAYPSYFLKLAYDFLTVEKPYRSSFQPVPVFNNNMWRAPFFSRVVASSSTFWQMMQQERPERLATFSSHSISFKTLIEAGFWQPNMVSEDSRIFWNNLLYYNGDYKVVPLSYPVSMDANLGKNFFETIKFVYKQQRRWTWGVENIPYTLFGFLKNKEIPLSKKIKFSFIQLEGFWSLSTNPLLIFMLGWLPLVVGGQAFNSTLLSYNLPRITRNLMNLAMLGLIGSAVISASLLPPRPKDIKKAKYIGMALQWIFIPFTIIFFGAVPGVETQTRLMLGGKYRLGFWVTPKLRFKNISKNSTTIVFRR